MITLLLACLLAQTPPAPDESAGITAPPPVAEDVASGTTSGGTTSGGTTSGGTTAGGDAADPDGLGPDGAGKADGPPPSAWDLERARRGETEPDVLEERSLLSQIGRTLLGLLVVVGIIYFLGKVALARLRPGQHGFGFGAGRLMRVVERLALDPKHSLFIVQLEGGRTLLLGSGEQGVHLISELDIPFESEAPPQKAGFRDALAKAAGRLTSTEQRASDDKAAP